MPTVELDIRQLADEGGTEPFAPITVTDAVLDEDGNTLTDTISEINAGLSDMTAIVTGKLSTSSGFTSYFSYPTGFTYLNCTVTNVALAYSVDGVSVWRTGLGLQAAGSPARLFVDNSTNGIRVFNDNSALYGADFKVLLVKN